MMSYLEDMRAAGVAIVLVSEELDELIAHSDRIAVMFQGRVMGEVGMDDPTKKAWASGPTRSGRRTERLGRMMGGEATSLPGPAQAVSRAVA